MDEFLEPQVAAAAAIAAVIASPKLRGFLRKGAVYGLAGALIAGDAVSSFARGVGQGLQQAATTASATAQQMAQNAANSANSARTSAEGSGDEAAEGASAREGQPV